MALHLIKLCVGADSIDDLRDWVSHRALTAIAAGLEPHSVHTTRMFPKRTEELLDGGSLYWVIKGAILIRQPILDLRPAKGADGIERCDIVLSPETIAVRPAPRRAFQGWRYLPAHEAPADVSVDQLAAPGLPPALVAELRTLGLL